MKLSKILAVTMSGLMITINSTTTRAMLPAQYTPMPPQVSTLGISSIVENLRRPLPEVEVSGQMSEQVVGQGNIGQDIGDLAEVYSHVKGDDQSSQVEEFNGDCGEVQWNIDPDGTMNISGSGNMTYEISTGSCWYASKEHIKNVIVGDGVRTISAEAFADCGNLESVKISDSVSHIGDNAFLGCTKLAKVKFCGKSEPSSVGISIFDGCDSLIDIKVPTDYANDSFFNKTVSKVLSEDFTYEVAKGKYDVCNWVLNDEGRLTITGAQSINLGYNARYVWEQYNNQIKSIFIDEGAKSMYTLQAFVYCPNLRYVHIPSSVSNILDTQASTGGNDNLCYIDVHPDNNAYASVDGVLYSKDMKKILAYPRGKSDEYFSLPKSVTLIDRWVFAYNKKLKYLDPITADIGDYAFYNCTNLRSIEYYYAGKGAFSYCSSLVDVKIHSSKLSSCQFSSCTSLTSIDIPSGTFVEDNPFCSCSALKYINVSSSNRYVTSKDGVLYSKDMTRLFSYPAGNERSSFSIPDKVSIIDSNAFHGCAALHHVYIPEGVKSIPYGVFYDCKNLEEIKIPESVTSFGANIFRNCASLRSVLIPQNITTISSGIFFGCSSLESVIIPANVSKISGSAFWGCTSLSDVKFLGIREPEVIESGVFVGCDSLSSIKVPVEYQNSTFADFNVSKVLDENGTEIIVESSSHEKKYIVSVIEIIFDQVVTVEEVTEAVRVMIPDQEKVEISVSVVEGNEVKVTVKSVDEETFNGFYDEIKACQNK